MEFSVALDGNLTDVVTYIQKLSVNHPIVLFYGDLGAGKTTLIKQIGEALHLTEQMNSPSYGIINEYSSLDKTYYHIDLYRLNRAEEAWDIGLIEILDSGAICWVEWPDILNEVWQSYDTLNVVIHVDNQGNRRIFVGE